MRPLRRHIKPIRSLRNRFTKRRRSQSTKFRLSIDRKETTFSGSRATGLGMIRNRISFGSAESGETYHRIAPGFPATGSMRAVDIVGYQAFGLRSHNNSLATCPSHRLRSTRGLHRLLLAKITFTFQEIGSTNKGTTDGTPVTGSLLLKTGSGFHRDIFGLPTDAFTNPATGTTNFRVAEPASLPFTLPSRFTWPTTIATDHRTRST